MKKLIILFVITGILRLPVNGQSIQSHIGESLVKPFVHPGMAQGLQDLQYMKQKVLGGSQPWKTAFENLKKNASLEFKPEPHTHISVGPYGVNDIGGKALFKSANAAYDHALMWYVTGNKAYADKAIEILNAWSPVLWDFDDNNAKLNVGLTAYYFLNAAEILKYSGSGWKEKDIQQFKQMMLTVYYPTVRDFFTEANGNWDASIINTLLCIGIFTDNHQIFNRAIERYHRGPGNSGITKYIYPNGQLQEATRDWGHVQLGIGEFEKAAQIAWTQGIDLYGVAENRLALGYEYTAKYMLGEEVPVYGVISARERDKFRDIYESIYYHYSFTKGIEMPYTSRVIEQHTRAKSSSVLLTALRAPVAGMPKTNPPFSIPDKRPSEVSLVGALAKPVVQSPADAIIVLPGDSIQAVLNANAGKGKWIILAKGVHTLTAPLRIPSGVTLAGEGKGSILFLASKLTGRTMVNADNDMHNVVIRDLLIEGATNISVSEDPNNERRIRSYMNAPSREGIVFAAEREGQMNNIKFENLTVQNFTKNGVSVRGASQVVVNNCNCSDNGSRVVPGEGFNHNLHLTHIKGCQITNNRFDTSPWGSGVDLSFSSNAVILNNEAARNKLSGIRCTESRNIKVEGNLTEGNDGNGILFDVLMKGTEGINMENNLSRNNGLHGIYIEKADVKTVKNNTIADNKL
jgi:parallel beta-helix repeat protein